MKTLYGIGMRRTVLSGLFICLFLSGCTSAEKTLRATVQKNFSTHMTGGQHDNEACAIIDELVFDHGDAKNLLVVNPQMTAVYSPGVTDSTDAYRQRFKRCQAAFGKLSQLKDHAFPSLLVHFSDSRPSINFQNHIMEHSVGYACYLIIYYQLQDQPGNYSEYGYQRKGRDGRNYPKPYHKGTPFDDAGGIQKWLAENKELPYPRMQVKCLEWLLAKEKAIGAWDAESYFLNILPLEIQILERKKEAGDDVGLELEKWRKVLADQDIQAIPPELLPNKTH